jgi:hypothetical protein
MYITLASDNIELFNTMVAFKINVVFLVFSINLYINMFIMLYILSLKPNVFFLYVNETNLKPNFVHLFANLSGNHIFVKQTSRIFNCFIQSLLTKCTTM